MLLKKQLFRFGLIALLFGFFATSAFAQTPDPMDSVIIESRTTQAFSGPCQSAPFMARVRVYITNKDTLTNLTLPLESRTISGGTYAILSRPATCGARTVSSVYNHQFSVQQLPNRSADFSNYHSNSPDSFMWQGSYNPAEDSSKLPPNLIRTPFPDIKFDTVFDIIFQGQFVLDSVTISSNSIRFFDGFGNPVPVNFVSGVITTMFDGVGGSQPSSSPEQYFLYQNYPNPFNSNTQLSFALSKSGKTTLEIFNVLGQKVSTLINEYLTVGNKIANWDGRDDRGVTVPSGIYFYQLRSGDFVERKKMVYLK